MDKMFFKDQMMNVQTTFGKKYGPHALERIYKHVKHLSHDEMETVVNFLVDTRRSAPTPNDFQEAARQKSGNRYGSNFDGLRDEQIKNMLAIKNRKNNANDEYFCTTCSDTGLVEKHNEELLAIGKSHVPYSFRCPETNCVARKYESTRVPIFDPKKFPEFAPNQIYKNVRFINFEKFKFHSGDCDECHGLGMFRVEFVENDYQPYICCDCGHGVEANHNFGLINWDRGFEGLMRKIPLDPKQFVPKPNANINESISALADNHIYEIKKSIDYWNRKSNEHKKTSK